MPASPGVLAEVGPAHRSLGEGGFFDILFVGDDVRSL
jgi:hypothetical protein